ncbi:MAG: K(+)-transporting ATPase subunit C [Bryobacterales bacterium]|nr:K(+)-transporting ATPase subunit C [Bryobacterales bacterium]
MTLVLTVATGLVYPALVTGLAQILFRDQANGSLIRKNGRAVGSSLIGQQFTRPEYFHPRPSAAGRGYDPLASGGSNLGPTSSRLTVRVRESVRRYRAENPQFSGDVPPDAVLASASGLDPHITPANAEAQAPRVAKARGVEPDRIRALIHRHLEGRDLGLLGEPRINVLVLNLALDETVGSR